ncbi:unnamed protein product [Oppiella nova]|uniref:non-specific serine/threonine protein kinase n=1 Tax=Oppiella nova TaxID=334625 RepID=A0A7R9QLY6_9ACAR|nr:unnamed protein product [Oppiella nova]CAG2167635.1 unnamed protein product [Oppiella nova]
MELYAVKICDLSGITEENDKQNLLLETKNMIKVRSVFAIKYYNSWIESDSLYIQMELCLDSLKNLLQLKRKLFSTKPPNRMTSFEVYISLEIFRELTECVQYMHEKRIIHRDLKPDNVLIALEEPLYYSKTRLKLCDFGLAKEALSIGAYVMSDDVGDPRYQAPEAMGTDYDHLADVYSLALIGAEIFVHYNK